MYDCHAKASALPVLPVSTATATHQEYRIGMAKHDTTNSQLRYCDLLKWVMKLGCIWQAVGLMMHDIATANGNGV
jgi:hypothetical protein